MNLDELRRRKKAIKLTTAELASLAELPVSTVSKIMTGETKNPSYLTIDILDKVIMEAEVQYRLKKYEAAVREYIERHPDETFDSKKFEEAYRKENNLNDAPIPIAVSKDESRTDILDPRTATGRIYDALARNVNHKVTVAEYYAMTTDKHTELINGMVIRNDSPTIQHQRVVERLGDTIKAFIKENDGTCEVFSNGINVLLDEENPTVVSPDLVVICDASRFTEKEYICGPDFVIEVTSPSTKKHDYTTKTGKYMDAGVREYWIVDLQKERVTSYVEGSTDLMYLYSFEDEIPVGIYDGKLNIKISNLLQK